VAVTLSPLGALAEATVVQMVQRVNLVRRLLAGGLAAACHDLSKARLPLPTLTRETIWIR